MKEARKKADDALKQAKATKTYEEFGILAEKISDDDYRVMMGDHKQVDRAKLPPEIVKTLLAMQPGQMTDLDPDRKRLYHRAAQPAHSRRQDQV